MILWAYFKYTRNKLALEVVPQTEWGDHYVSREDTLSTLLHLYSLYLLSNMAGTFWGIFKHVFLYSVQVAVANVEQLNAPIR